jgi:lipid II:glycine glycyltransferase (peptidoglycan interpeptide bridge formation enzyme)
MRYYKARGCATYDLLGIAPPDAPPDHPWQGISAFKEKFGGEVVMYPPEQEIVLRPIANWMLQWKRRILG